VTDYYWVQNLHRRDNGGSAYISDVLPEAEMRAKVNEDEDGEDTWFDLLRLDQVFTRGEMEADPILAATLAAWMRGDRSAWARHLAQYVLSETGPHAPSNRFTVDPDQMEILRSCAHLPECAAALRIIELRDEMEALADRFRVRYPADAL
jgi:hypothetical protein